MAGATTATATTASHDCAVRDRISLRTASIASLSSVQLSYYLGQNERLLPAFHFTPLSGSLISQAVEDTVVRAIYQLPLCVSFAFLLVQALRVSAAELVDYVMRHSTNNPEPRW
jgi:hypothetical protein